MDSILCQIYCQVYWQVVSVSHALQYSGNPTRKNLLMNDLMSE
jgi:hypothetical protein